MSLPDPALWQTFRDQMPITRRSAYFDHAAVAPLAGPGLEASLRWAHEAAEIGTPQWPTWSAATKRLRTKFAGWINAEPEEIALIRSTTEGITLAAEGYPWQPGDNVVTLADEFPSNQYPWLNLGTRGVETRRVPVGDDGVDLNRLAEACDARTRIVSCSWVGYASGYRLDVAEVARLAHDRGALYFLDAIQGLGVFPLDVRATGVDFFSADGHKWMLGPEGAGFFYVRRELLDRLRPFGVGWSSVVQATEYTRIELNIKPSAARYEGGAMNMGGFVALEPCIDLLISFGAEQIARRVLAVTDLACERMRAIGGVIHSVRSGGHGSGIVSCELPGRDPQKLRLQCLDRGVILSVRNGRLRLSPHAYNNEEDIDRLIAALQASET